MTESRYRLGWLLVLILGLPVMLTLGAVFGNDDAMSQTQCFEQAERAVEVLPTGITANDTAVYSVPSLTEWQTLPLPDMVTRNALVDLPRGKPQRAWYHISYTAPADLLPGEPLMLYIPRMMPGEFQLWVNGNPVANNYRNWRLQWNRPITVRLPSERTQEILLATPFHPEVGYAIGRICIGTEAGLVPVAAQRVFWQTTLLQASSLVVLLMGILSLYTWQHRRKEDQHLLLALMSLAWWLCNLRYFVEVPDSDLIMAWHEWLGDAATSWIVLLVYLFAFRFDDRRFPRIEKGLLVLVGGITVTTMPFWPWSTGGSTLQHWVNAAVAVLVTTVLTRLAIRGRLEIRLLCAALWLCIGFGIHDILLLERRISPEHLYLFAYSSVFIFAAFEFAVQRRYLAALADQEQMSATLAERLQQRQSELEASYVRLQENDRQQTQLLERQRLMADMHDGLGSSLVSSLVMMEQGQLTQQEIASVLRECVDDLRLMLDTLDPGEDTFADLLADLRHRIEPRLTAAGIKLEWRIDNLPKLSWMTPEHRLNALRIIQEAVTNSIKHAGASNIRVSGMLHSGLVEMCVADNGCGFELEAGNNQRNGRGIVLFRRRATKAGGELILESVPGHGTSVKLQLPILNGHNHQHTSDYFK